MMLLLALTIGVAVGIGVSRAYGDVKRELEKKHFAERKAEMADEIKQLRAWKAQHIGHECDAVQVAAKRATLPSVQLAA